eukprot:TRINITY_DN3331_c0_g1_i1.p1 TRINITY_DN3331_c0_g1~~TRINITY_DN3331_c0_g1_i1.p1  ORF type:complete len:199 (-),score=43.94 TRINITY_DN3331_c0_g1_i1:376-972(-)
MSVLQEQDRNLVARSLGGSTELYSTAVKIYHAEQNSWTDTGFVGIGILCHRNDIGFIRFVRFGEGELFGEEELYKDFIYSPMLPQFHFFESKDKVVGIAFADASDAEQFHTTIQNMNSGNFKKPGPIRSPPPAPMTGTNSSSSMRQAPPPRPTPPATPTPTSTPTPTATSNTNSSSSSASQRQGKVIEALTMKTDEHI